MKGFDAYKMYVAIKLHFQSNFYYFKFGGKAKTSKTSYDSRRDRLMFERIAKVYDAEQFELLLVANFLDNSNVWIGEIASEAGREKYLNLKKRLQSLQYTFKQDMLRIKDEINTKNVESFDAMFQLPKDDSQYPPIVSLMLQHDVSLESFIIMNKILNFMPRVTKCINDDLLFPEVSKLILKYSPFVKLSTKQFRDIMKSVFLDGTQEKMLDV